MFLDLFNQNFILTFETWLIAPKESLKVDGCLDLVQVLILLGTGAILDLRLAYGAENREGAGVVHGGWRESGVTDCLCIL